MCVAIFQNINAVKLKKEDFIQYGRSNHDGFGMLHVKETLNINTQKFEPSLVKYVTTDLEAFWNYYDVVFNEINAVSPLLVHFRLGTAGKMDTLNCHPFLVNENIGFIHNGIITIDRKGYDDFSDTYVFNETILKPLGDDIINNETTIKLISSFIGYSNKLIFLNTKKQYLIFNEDCGEWDTQKSTWFSFKKSYNYSKWYRNSDTYNAYDDYDDDYHYSKNVVHKCVKCNTYHSTNRLITITNQYGVSNFICTDCITEETKIVDVSKAVIPFAKRGR